MEDLASLLSLPPVDATVVSLLAALIAVLVAVYVYVYVWSYGSAPVAEKDKEEQAKVESRDFTPTQLKDFIGTDNKPIYVSINNEVFDVTKASEYYGPGGPYHLFAGHDASRCLAKLSFNEEDLNGSTADLSPMEKDVLMDWYHKFKYYRGYPMVGRLVVAPEPRPFTHEELKEYNGTNPVPEGRVHPPVYVAVDGKVFDTSFGGFSFYGPGNAYNLFAGKDASRALAKMSFKDEDVLSSNIDDLTEAELKVMHDWAFKFERVKKYPIVGTLSE